LALFRQYDDHFFTVLTGGNRHLYEEIVARLYERFYSGFSAAPTELEVKQQIYRLLGERPELWAEEESPAELPSVSPRGRRRLRIARGEEELDPATKAAQQRTRHIIARLKHTGWLETETLGLRTTVEMTLPALIFIERMMQVRKGLVFQLNNVLASLKPVLERARVEPAENAAALHAAPEQAETFLRVIRGILSDMKRIRQAVMSAPSLKERLDTFFNDFIAELLLRDFETIYVTNHPFRFRARVLALLDELRVDGVFQSKASDAYIELGYAASLEEAGDAVFQDLSRIERIFDEVKAIVDRITGFRRDLEGRLRNTIRYAETNKDGLSSRSHKLVEICDRILAAMTKEEAAQPVVPTLMFPMITYYGRDVPPILRVPSKEIERTVLRKRYIDPEEEARRRSEAEFIERVELDPALVAAFLDRVLGDRAILRSRDIAIRNIDDFLAFEWARFHAVHGSVPQELRERFQLTLHAEDRYDNEWLNCRDFEIRRASPLAVVSADAR
jgi:hypothetical protein